MQASPRESRTGLRDNRPDRRASRRRRNLLLSFVLLGNALLATALQAGSAVAAESLLVAAAMSLREPLLEISREPAASPPGFELELSFGASSALGLQIRYGAPIDVMLSANEVILDDLAQRGLIVPESRIVLAQGRLVILRAPGSALEITSARDLFGDGIARIALPGEAVPLGRYARQWLRGQGLEEGLVERIVLTEHARATLSAVDLGQVDLAIVYATDARLARRAQLVYEIPESEGPAIRYGAVAIRSGEGVSEADASRRSAALHFLRYLQGPDARRIMQLYGFEVPGPTP